MKYKEYGEWSKEIGITLHIKFMKKLLESKLESAKEDLGGFGEMEEELLQQVCVEHNVPTVKLVSTLLNEEFENQGATRHSKIFGKIKTQLSKEWREDMDQIIKNLSLEKEQFDEVSPYLRPLYCCTCEEVMIYDKKQKSYKCNMCDLIIKKNPVTSSIKQKKCTRKLEKTDASN